MRRSDSRRDAWLVVWALVWLMYTASNVKAQPASGTAQRAQDKPFEIEANVNRVLVEVVVRDRHGQVVNDLKKEDFQVEDNGKARALSAFSVEGHGAVEGAAQSGSKEDSASSPASPANPSPAPPSTEARFILFLFDDLHLSLEDLAQAKASAAKMLEGALGGTDMAAVVSLSGNANSGLTRDHKVLQDAIASLKPRAVYQISGSECPNISYYQADQIQNKHDSVALQAATQQVFNCSPGMNPQRDHDVAERTAESTAMRVVMRGALEVHQTYAAISEYVRRMGKLPAGQRLVVLVSSGFLSITPEAMSEESHVIDLAAQANVTISALDARGLYTTNLSASESSLGSGRTLQLQEEYRRNTATTNENAMAELANGTGGSFFHNSNDLEAGFRALTETPSCMYLLELPLEGIKADGSYHRLKVKVDRKEIEVRARRGYFVPKPDKNKK